MPGDLENLRSANRSSFCSKPWYVGDRDGRARSSRRSGAARRAPFRARRGPAGDRRRARRSPGHAPKRRPRPARTPRPGGAPRARLRAPLGPDRARVPAGRRRPTRSSRPSSRSNFLRGDTRRSSGCCVEALPASGRAKRLHEVGVAFGAELAEAAGLEPATSPQRAFEQMCSAVRRLGYQASVVSRRRGDGGDRDADLPAAAARSRAARIPPRSTAGCGPGSPRARFRAPRSRSFGARRATASSTTLRARSA